MNEDGWCDGEKGCYIANQGALLQRGCDIIQVTTLHDKCGTCMHGSTFSLNTMLHMVMDVVCATLITFIYIYTHMCVSEFGAKWQALFRWILAFSTEKRGNYVKVYIYIYAATINIHVRTK